MSQFKQTRIQSSGAHSSIKTAASIAAITLGALLAACTPQDDQASADGGAVASDSPAQTMRSTAGEAVERARQANSTSTDAAAGAAASGSAAAAQSAEDTLRKTEAQVNAADKKLDEALEQTKQKVPGSPAN